MDRMVNNIQLIWKLAWISRTYRTYNSTVKFSKNVFYNKLLGSVILLRIIPSITFIDPMVGKIVLNDYCFPPYLPN